MDEKVMAAINLNAVLRSLELLCSLDEQSKTLIGSKNLAIRFSVPTLPPLVLAFNNGVLKALYAQNVKSQINLKFKSVEYFNKMINGEANPIPTKGFFNLSFLQGPFTELTKILESYLKADPERLRQDIIFREKNTKLTAFVAFCTLSEIANYDKVGQKVAHHTPNGKLLIKVGNEPFISVVVKDGHFHTEMGNFENPHAIMAFDDIDTAGGILRGELDSFGAIGRGKLCISGKIAMVDNFNKLLGLVAGYLA